jgi:hypothetical protein
VVEHGVPHVYCGHCALTIHKIIEFSKEVAHRFNLNPFDHYNNLKEGFNILVREIKKLC